VIKTPLTFGYMLEIIWCVAIARYVFLDADASLEVRLQEIHLFIYVLEILRQTHGTHLVQKENEGRTREKRVRAYFFPQVDRILLFIRYR
jgi:hypothetical protein